MASIDPAPPTEVNGLIDRRVVVVDDHQLLSESLALALSVQGYDVRRVPVPAHSGAPAALVTAILRVRPRVVLLDLELGAFGDGNRLIEPLARADVRVVVMTGSPDRARWGRAVLAGARKVVSKARPLSELTSVVRRANQGLGLMDAAEREELLGAWHTRLVENDDIDRRLAQLSRRESAVLGQLMAGLSVRDIAARGVVSEATVRTQVKAVLTKLGVSTQLAAVSVANRASWHPPTEQAS
ncbi:LuxR family transcriptional regulator [Nocardioides humi]